MITKNTLFILFALLTGNALAQVSGNVNYMHKVHLPDNNIDVRFTNTDDFVINVKGLFNLKADSYVAIFSLSQTAKNTAEVNKLLDERINSIKSKIKDKAGVTMFVDMISFVPVYEYAVEKKIFSKKTYNEIPAGFELKKNLHFEYSDPEFLNELIAVCADAEVYDLIRVDYFATNIEQKKKELLTKAHAMIKEKMKTNLSLVGITDADVEKEMVDGFTVVYPVEMYKNYQAYNSSSLNLSAKGNVNNLQKSITLYYQPFIDKEFDFVMNPTIMEPVIQILYEIKIRINKVEEKPQLSKPNNQYFMISPAGEIKSLGILK